MRTRGLSCHKLGRANSCCNRGELAPAGPAGNLKNTLLRRRVGCYVAGCVLPSQKKKNKPGMEIEEAPHSPLLAVPAGPAGAAQEEHLLLQRKASAVGLHHTTFARFGVSVYLWSQNVRRLDVSLLLRRLWPAG